MVRTEARKLRDFANRVWGNGDDDDDYNTSVSLGFWTLSTVRYSKEQFRISDDKPIPKSQ
jgi:hypothetical protein